MIWVYVNPVSSGGILFQGDSAQSNTVFRCYRYNTNYAAFNALDIRPIGPLEYYLNTDYDDLNNRLNSIALIPTDFPDPVVPATKRCGILVKSATTGDPAMS